MIESGHFRFHLVGERILHLDARLFYKHRGLERAAEGNTLEDGLLYAARACAACSVANTVSYALACEDALGLGTTAELARVRTILLELERTWNHLNDIAAVCAGVGLAAGNNRFAGLTERARRLNAHLTGHRFLSRHGPGRPQPLRRRRRRPGGAGGAGGDPRRGAPAWREPLQRLLPRPPRRRRRRRNGRRRKARRRRACCACRWAPRTHAPAPEHAWPTTGSPGLPPRRPVGDVRARLEQRALELPQSIELLDTLLDGPVEPTAARRGSEESRIGIGRVESPRGATSCIVERDGDRIARLRLRTGSYANWPVVAFAAADNMLPDFPLIKELRALLRLRRPLMLTLLRDLRRLRRRLDLPAPDHGRSLAIRRVDAGSCNGCEHELTLATSPYYDLQRYGLGIVASPAMPTCSSSPAPSPHACTSRSSPPTTRCPSRAASPRSATAPPACNLLTPASSSAPWRRCCRRPPHPRLPAHTRRDRRGAPPPDRRPAAA